MSSWEETFKSLRIPAQYASSQNLYNDAETLKFLETWRDNIPVALDTLKDLISQKQATGEPIDNSTLANIIFSVSPFVIEPEDDGLDHAPWSTRLTRDIAVDILSIPQISQPNVALIRHVLLNHLKPIFSSNPHPYLNTTTGRKLPRPAGGPGASQDYYDEQNWKTYPGIWSVLAWAVRNIPPNAYEDIWPLVIPPTMTLLDDYQAKHKLESVHIVSFMLRGIPKEILRRTGVHELIFTSLKTALSHLSDPETPALLRLTILGWLSLTVKVDEPGSFEFFDHLCTLVVNGIIEGVWLYSEENFIAMKATIDALPDVLRALDTASVRFLKSLVPQLAHILAMQNPLQPPSQSQSTSDVVELQKSAGRLLLVIIDVAACRMEGWKLTILDCVARCWVGLVDSGTGDSELQAILREIMLKLVAACPDISQSAYKALLMEDQSMFSGLVGMPPSPVD